MGHARAALLYSLMQTCAVNAVDGYQYLRALLTASDNATSNGGFMQGRAGVRQFTPLSEVRPQ
jgi:hypothetical protein